MWSVVWSSSPHGHVCSLLAKLEFYGISGISNKLIRSYLNNRYQRVEITNNMHIKSTSSWEPMKHATPVLFAGDTSIIISSTTENEFKNDLSFVINATVAWCKNNLLTLNLKKTQFMQFLTNHYKKIDTQIAVMDFVIPNTTSIKFLGLILDNKLTWKAHSRELVIKLNKACYAIRAIKSLVSLKVLISIYFSCFHSLLTYGIIFWGNSPISKNIFKIQKRVIRIITNKPRCESCKHLFKQLKILTLPSQYIFSVLYLLQNTGIYLCLIEIYIASILETSLIDSCHLLI